MSSPPPERTRAPSLRRLAWLALACIGSGGCCMIGLCPPPPPLPPETVIRTVDAQSGRLQTLTSTNIRLVLSSEHEGETDRTPTLRGHIVFDAGPPGLWLRAEKVGREIFTLKALGQRFWLFIPDTAEVLYGGPVAYAKLPHMVFPEEVRGFFADPESLGLNWPGTQMSVQEDDYRFEVFMYGALYRRVLVDRRDLVITSIEDYDVLGRPVTRVRLDDHEEFEQFDGAVFPRRLIVERPAEGTKIDLKVRDPEFNRPFDPQVFEPKQRPGWNQVNLDLQPLSDAEAFRTE